MAARTLMHAQPAGSPRLGHVPTGEPRASCWQGRGMGAPGSEPIRDRSQHHPEGNFG
jgi:hypothetical protein